MMYVYAIVDARMAPLVENARGLDNAPTTSLAHGRVSAVYSMFHGPDVQPTTENARRHEAVVEAIMERATVLPVRFGAVFRDAEQLREVVAAHHDGLLQSLQRVENAVEVSVRVTWASGPSAEWREPCERPTTGRAYMLQRLQEQKDEKRFERWAREVVGYLHERLAESATDTTWRLLRSPSPVLAVAYLVPRTRMDAFMQQAKQLADTQQELRLTVTGPWPPHNFSPRFGREAAHH